MQPPACPSQRRGTLIASESVRAAPGGSLYLRKTPKGAQKGGPWLDPSGYDAGKKIKGRKRHILVDTLGLLLNVVVHPADIQDRDGAFHLLRRARRTFDFQDVFVRIGDLSCKPDAKVS